MSFEEELGKQKVQHQNQEHQNQEHQNQEHQNQEHQNQEHQNQEHQNQEPRNQECQNRECQTLERTVMSNIPVYKTWNVPSYADNGPVTIALRLPRVSVIDAAGNEIVIPPEQAALLGSKLADITDWLHYGDSDWSVP